MDSHTASTGVSATKARRIADSDISETDIIIGLLGPTGAGKSSFINKATGYEDGIGHSLHSCTDTITAIKCCIPEIADGDIVFVDTPGFDDIRFSEKVVLEMISKWLHDTYKRNIKLNGLLYFHKISDNRMGGSSLVQIELFQRIVGKNFQNIVLTSTMWDEVDEGEGEQREKELMEVYWKWLIKRGSTVARFHHSQASALEILQPVIKMANSSHAIQLQEEIERFGGELSRTDAGRALSLDLQAVFQKHRDALQTIRKELAKPNLSNKELRRLMVDFHAISDELKTINSELQAVATPYRIRVWLQRSLAPRNFLQLFNIFRFGVTRRFRTETTP